MTRITGNNIGETPATLSQPPEHLSYSQLTSLHGRYQYSCARKWAYEKVMGVPFVSSGALICGSSFDLAANAWFEERMKGPVADEQESVNNAIKIAHASLEGLAETETFNSPITDKQIAAYKAALVVGVTAFTRFSRSARCGAVQTRHEFTLRNKDGYQRTIVGWSDRIDTDGCIVDHKWTGSAKWDGAGNWDSDWLAEKRDQLVVYWLSRMAEFKRCVKAGLPWDGPPVEPAGKLVVVLMRSNSRAATVKELRMEFSNDDKDRVLRFIAEADLIARSGRYPARPGPACGSCSSVPRCQADSERSDPLFTELTGIPMAKEDAA